MPVGIRHSLDAYANGRNCDNAGLALERYLKTVQSGGEHADRGNLLDNVASVSVPAVYEAAFERWKAALSAMGAKTEKLRVTDRLIVGLGSESALETSVTMNRVYGVPVIPGSALKGVARHYYERAEGERDDEVLRVLFGAGPKRSKDDGTPDGGSAGFITYYDAWYVPTGNEKPLRGDVITVHHPKYYSSAGKDAAPTDFDNPIPVPFVSAAGSFLVAVGIDAEGEKAETWLNYALDLLKAALADWGVGAKTSSGYGRLVPTAGVAEQRPRAFDPARCRLLQSISAIPGREVRNRIHGFYEQWQSLPDGDEKRAVAKALLEKLSIREVRNLWEGKPLAQVTSYLSTGEATEDESQAL